MRRIAAFLIAIFASTASAFSEPPVTRETVRVESEPIASFAIGRPSETRFGKLDYLGGMELLAKNRHFGGLSGLIVSPNGAEILAISDNGLWVAIELEQKADGAPVAVRKALIAPMIGPKGKSLLKSGRADTEAITLGDIDGKGELFVSTEGRHTVYAFPYPPDFNAAGRVLDLPLDKLELRYNKGLEALAASPADGDLKGALVAIGEQGKSYNDNMPGLLIGGPRPGRFNVKRDGDYDATDAAFLPGGDMALLERRFNLRHGIGMRIRRIKAADLKPGATVDGEILMEAGFTNQIDNMEGIAVHRNEAGDTILTLVSDDNRSILQRTLLLRFRLAE